MQITYATTVDYANKTQKWLSGCLGGDDNLDKARAKLQHDIDYYESIGDIVYRAHIDALCLTCHGSGKVAKKRPKFASKTCPECRGKNSVVRAETWINRPWTMPTEQNNVEA